MSGSAKKKTAAVAKKVSAPPMIFLICKAIGQIRSGYKGASRAAIRNYLVNNNGKTAGATFNYHLRNALKKGVEAGIIKFGATEQRYKLGDKAKSVTNPPKPKKKKVTKKKVTAKKKKKVTKKKKKVTKKKKKVTKKKKKTTTKKRKTAASKKKTASKKRSAKKPAKKRSKTGKK